MTRRIPCALRRALALALCALSLVAAGAAEAAPTRIMPLGDSITGSPGCWRALLWNKLQANGYTNVDFVGTRAGDGCGVPYDGDNEGWGGYLVTNIASQNLLPGWLAQTSPDIVMMHLGTNDAWSSLGNERILGAYTTLVNQMRAQNPNMKILVAQITPMDSRACATCAQSVVTLNAAIPAWAAGLSTAQSPITVVDQWTGYDTTTDTYDGVHPSSSGNQKISDRWYPALVAALGGAQTPSFSLSASPATLSVALAPSTAGRATSTLTVAGAGGFTGSVALSAAAVAGGTVTFSPTSTTGTSVMTVTIPANAQPGTYTLTVNGTSGTMARSLAVSVVVTQATPAQDFTLALAPASVALTQGASGTSTISIARTSYSSAVTLSASGLPAGVTATFSPGAPTGTSSTLTLSASSTAATGPATVTITGVGATGGLTRTATVSLTVNASGGGTGTAPCSPATVFAGNTGNFNTTGAVCYRTAAAIHGWGCYNMDGRTVKVNGVSVTCGAALPAPWSDGSTYFAVTAGTFPWAGIYSW